ncbi:MAG: PhzF family phenazine biosynthesis protein [Terriglobales bacterium]
MDPAESQSAATVRPARLSPRSSKVPLWHADAFTARPFAGNPAAVCLLEAPGETQWMQAVAAEMNLSETAFLAPLAAGGFHLRWFTPKVEVDLCGHGTLAAAHTLWEARRLPRGEAARFRTRSGWLTAAWRGGWIELDFPARPPRPIGSPPGLEEALGARPRTTCATHGQYLAEFEHEETVRGLRPDFGRLAGLDARGVIVTAAARGGDYDFVSRYFAPAAGIEEDPVTGSAHCCLAPYWAQKLGKREMTGYQASARGGVVKVRWEGERVFLAGRAVTVFTGFLRLP